jgi:hypothetical protein
MYSGLLECPLTTRLVKVVDGAYAVESGGAVAGCGASTILTFQECYHAAAVTIGMVLVCLILHVVFERLLSNLSRLCYRLEASIHVCVWSNSMPLGLSLACYSHLVSCCNTAGTGGQTFRNASGSDVSLPPGCSATTDPTTPLTVKVFFNKFATSTTTCGKDAGIVTGATAGLVNVTVSLNAAKDIATLVLTGPADVWFGVGFAAYSALFPL